MVTVLRGWALAVLLSVLLWQPASAQPTAVQPAAVQSSPLSVLLTTDRFAYQPGEAIRFTLRVQNVSTQPVAISFATAQRFDVVIQSDVTIVDRWSSTQVFAQARSELTWRPGETITYADSWLPASRLLPGAAGSGPRLLSHGLFEMYAEITGIAVQPASLPVPIVIGAPLFLSAGCTELADLLSIEVPADIVAGTVEPRGALKALWQQSPGNGAFTAYSPRLSAVSNLRSLSPRLPFTVCVDQPAEITLP